MAANDIAPPVLLAYRSRTEIPHRDILMAIRQNVSGDSYEILLAGRVDGAAANDLEQQILANEKAGAREIFINLAEADFLCSAGIRAILQHWRQMKSQGKRLAVVHPSKPVQEILKLTGFYELVVEGAGGSPK